MSILMFGLLAAFVLVLLVLAARRRGLPTGRRGASVDSLLWYTGDDSRYHGPGADSGCDSAASDGGSCDGGGDGGD